MANQPTPNVPPLRNKGLIRRYLGEKSPYIEAVCLISLNRGRKHDAQMDSSPEPAFFSCSS